MSAVSVRPPGGSVVESFPLCLLTELPGPPTNMAISNIGPRSVTLQFKPGYDGKTSISRWQVEAQVRRTSSSCSFVFVAVYFRG